MATGCSFKRCGSDDAVGLIAAKFVFQTTSPLPAPVETGRVAASPATCAAENFPDPFEPPPRA
jgi:hypothetical protein